MTAIRASIYRHFCVGDAKIFLGTLSQKTPPCPKGQISLCPPQCVPIEISFSIVLLLRFHFLSLHFYQCSVPRSPASAFRGKLSRTIARSPMRVWSFACIRVCAGWFGEYIKGCILRRGTFLFSFFGPLLPWIFLSPASVPAPSLIHIALHEKGWTGLSLLLSVPISFLALATNRSPPFL